MQCRWRALFSTEGAFTQNWRGSRAIIICCMACCNRESMYNAKLRNSTRCKAHPPAEWPAAAGGSPTVRTCSRYSCSGNRISRPGRRLRCLCCHCPLKTTPQKQDQMENNIHLRWGIYVLGFFLESERDFIIIRVAGVGIVHQATSSDVRNGCRSPRTEPLSLRHIELGNFFIYLTI